MPTASRLRKNYGLGCGHATFTCGLSAPTLLARSGPEDATHMSSDASPTAATLEPEAYRALYEHCPDGVLFTVPDGRVLAANPAACEILRMTEAEICAVGREGLADRTDERWGMLLAERTRTGHVQGVARMICGDGATIEVEMSAQIFRNAAGEERACTILRDRTERAAMERQLVEMSARLRELSLTDELTGLRNRRGFNVVGPKVLAMVDRQLLSANVAYLDIDNMKQLNDSLGHSAGDAALQAVAAALRAVTRRSDVAARIGGDEFVVLTLGLDERDRAAIERRIRSHLASAQSVAEVGHKVEVSIGWAAHMPDESSTLEDLVNQADLEMYRSKASKSAGEPS